MKSGNGDVYTGNWVRGKEEGPGVLTYSNGNLYAGDWRGGQMDGKGIMNEKGQKYTVEHIAGYLISKVPIDDGAVVDPDWNNANRLYENHMKKKKSDEDGGGGGGGGGGNQSDVIVKLRLEKEMFEKKYNDLLAGKAAGKGDDFDDDDETLEGLKRKLATAREQRDAEKIRADEAAAKEKVLTLELEEARFKLEDFESLKSENERLKANGGGGGGDSADLNDLQRKCAELERQLQLTRKSGGSVEGLDPLELKAKVELQESEIKSLKAARDELKKLRTQSVENQQAMMKLEMQNEELIKEINVQRQRSQHLHSQLSEANVGGEYQAEMKELRKEIDALNAAKLAADESMKNAKKREKELEARARKADELEVEIVRLRQSKQTGDQISFKTLDKKTDELDRLRQQNADLQRKLEEMGVENDDATPGKKDKKSKKKKKGTDGEEDLEGMGVEELNVKIEGLQSDLKKEKKKHKRAAAERDVYEQQLLADQAQLRKVQRQLDVAHGKVMVYCLIRQLLPFEQERGDQIVIQPGEQAGIIVSKATDQQLTFDEVFAETATGADLFAEAQPTVRKVVEGSHASIVSYGPMESGKTFYSSQISPLAIRELFNSFQSSSHRVTVLATAVEICDEGIIDLNASNPGQPIEVMKNPYGVVTLIGATKIKCNSADDAIRNYTAAISSKTKPRSHFCFFLDVELLHKINDSMGKGKLSLIDLAGTGELGRQSDVGCAKYVNNSNRALTGVVQALKSRADAVPYRDDPLTTILSDTFGGNARTHVFAHCSPGSYSATESMHSLEVAMAAAKVFNRPLRQFDTADTARLRKLVATQISEDDAAPKNYDIVTYQE